MDMTKHDRGFHKLLTYLARIPSVRTNDTPWGGFGSGMSDAGWWVKFSLKLDHHLAWNAVQEIAYVLNELSLSERLPTVFKPVSPPPYLNGGPRDYLGWVIECQDRDTRPGTIADWMESRLPNPVEDEAAWPEAE
ncbi:hypothetical protein ACFOKF_14605 [Sphingobium rhizovicinum]|uniref:Uncharacterized protein n=1 Tax=Sphingobium rhizovicinum TaxID=432308 RepID=A0ABV7NGT7_9SPHN